MKLDSSAPSLKRIPTSRRTLRSISGRLLFLWRDTTLSHRWRKRRRPETKNSSVLSRQPKAFRLATQSHHSLRSALPGGSWPHPSTRPFRHQDFSQIALDDFFREDGERILWTRDQLKVRYSFVPKADTTPKVSWLTGKSLSHQVQASLASKTTTRRAGDYRFDMKTHGVAQTPSPPPLLLACYWTPYRGSPAPLLALHWTPWTCLPFSPLHTRIFPLKWWLPEPHHNNPETILTLSSSPKGGERNPHF